MRKVLAILAAALLLFTGAAAEAPDPTPAPDWPEGWIRYDQPAGWLETEPFMWYWVYTPENLQPGAPLVIYLHSSLGMNRKALTEPLPRRIIDGEITDVQAVVLVPQLPGDTDKDWLSALDQVNNIIVKVMEEYQIDPERVSLSGFSLGGIAVFDFVESAPGRYPRVLSVSGKVRYVHVQVDSFRNTELKVFIGTRDTVVNTASAVSFVQWMLDAGYSAELEELDMGHEEVPEDVFARRDILQWLWLIPEEEGAE